MVRKKRKRSQADVGKLIGINGDAYGRYERDEVRPTIEMAVKVADALEISLDFLVGKINLEIDTKAMKRLEELSNLPEDEQKPIFKVLDGYLRDFKARKTYTS